MVEHPIRSRIIGSALVAVLAIAGAAYAAGPEHEQESQQQRPPQQHQQGTQQQAQPVSGQQGSGAAQSSRRGEDVKQLQRELASRGLYEGDIDGIFGPKTTAALRNFQAQNELDTTGAMNQETADALGLGWERQPVRGSESAGPQGTMQRQPQGPSEGARGDTGRQPQGQPSEGARGAPGQMRGQPDQIDLANLSADQGRQLQQRLQSLGFYQGKIDGVVGPQTRTALQRYFQQQAQMAMQGRVSEPAMSALGVEASEQQPVRGQEQGSGPGEMERGGESGAAE